MRAAVKKDIHSGYQGIEVCMNKELKAWLRTCETCRENELAPYKEKLISRKEHGRRFTYHDKEYLVTACYKSNFCDSHMAHYGIPKQLVTAGPQFTSAQFKFFTDDRLAQLVERRTTVRKVEGSSPRLRLLVTVRTHTQALKITEENVLPLYLHPQMVRHFS